jgi:hypothetical protein
MSFLSGVPTRNGYHYKSCHNAEGRSFAIAVGSFLGAISIGYSALAYDKAQSCWPKSCTTCFDDGEKSRRMSKIEQAGLTDADMIRLPNDLLWAALDEIGITSTADKVQYSSLPTTPPLLANQQAVDPALPLTLNSATTRLKVAQVNRLNELQKNGGAGPSANGPSGPYGNAGINETALRQKPSVLVLEKAGN